MCPNLLRASLAPVAIRSDKIHGRKAPRIIWNSPSLLGHLSSFPMRRIYRIERAADSLIYTYIYLSRRSGTRRVSLSLVQPYLSLSPPSLCRARASQTRVLACGRPRADPMLYAWLLPLYAFLQIYTHCSRGGMGLRLERINYWQRLSLSDRRCFPARATFSPLERGFAFSNGDRPSKYCHGSNCYTYAALCGLARGYIDR